MFLLSALSNDVLYAKSRLLLLLLRFIIGFSNIVVCYYIHNPYTLLYIFIYILYLIVSNSC